MLKLQLKHFGIDASNKLNKIQVEMLTNRISNMPGGAKFSAHEIGAILDKVHETEVNARSNKGLRTQSLYRHNVITSTI